MGWLKKFILDELIDRIVSRIMGEGDLATLVEKTSTIIDEKEAKRLNQKIKKVVTQKI